jgi:outer membrane receptor protein involved in Fe transport
MIRTAITSFCLLLFSAGLTSGQPGTRNIRGVVHDQQGYVVVGAQIALADAGSYRQRTTSAHDGSFLFQAAPGGPLTVTVDAPGFAHFTTALAQDGRDKIEIVLLPGTVRQEINVTANRVSTAQIETAESMRTLSRSELDTAASEAVDQTLRQIPGFTLFRRSDSRTANPTSQGASLRGVGGSGASRSLVLHDDIPLNDPFGGWVYWGRIPRADVNSIEVLRGGGSSLYGSGAMSGVMNIVPQAPPDLLSLELSHGSMETPDLSLAGSWRRKSWILETNGEIFRTAGYILVPEGLRGSVDRRVNSYHATGQLAVRRKLAQGDLFVAGDFYDEARNNGTPFQTNDTQLWQLDTGLNLPTRLAAIQLRGYGSGQSYNQTFSSISANRNSETLVRAQHVPAQQAGGSLVLSRTLGSFNSLVGGADSRYVRGFSNETAFAASQATSLVFSGGRQLTTGAFLQDAIRLHPRLLFTAGVRYDNWDNYEAHTQTVPMIASIKPSFTAFTDQSDHAFSPRGTLLFRASDQITLAASAYRSFRAPTLNELYRSFRLGNVLTLANAGLQAERLSGAEAGANVFLKRARIHTAFFWMEVADPVANVTLSSTPALITRQRENLGRTRSRGVEADARWRLNQIDITAAYQYTDAVVTSFAADPTLVGLEVPQVAPHQFTLQARYNLPAGWTLATEARASSRQFDDDQNLFPLDSFFLMDAYVSKRVGRGVDLFATVENMFNSRIQVARTPLLNVGPPIYGRAGIRLRWE